MTFDPEAQGTTDVKSEEPLVTIREVAIMLDCSEASVRRYVKGLPAKGMRRAVPPLPAQPVGGLLKFRRSDVREWLKKQRTGS